MSGMNKQLSAHMQNAGIPVTRSCIHHHDVEFYELRGTVACRYCYKGCSVCERARAALTSFHEASAAAG
jgi:hypothetical protein